MKKQTTMILYFFTMMGLIYTPYVTALPASYTPILTTENDRNILPPDEIAEITRNPFIDDTTAEDLFKQQLGTIAATEQFIEIHQQKNDDHKKTLSPTEIFFNSLTTCTPGIFYERNIYADLTGPDMLVHNIIGIKGNTCEARLMTPNEKITECKFDIYAIDDINDAYMVEGLVEYDPQNTSQKSINADLSWSTIKVQHCIYSKYPNIKPE
jgi:hypothetical protein